ncbi:putative mitogen-activated protein kinase kinase STE-STE7 family [Helianthus anomalus]
MLMSRFASKLHKNSKSTKHHNVQTLLCYQSFYDNGAVSIILEYMDGGSLADFLKTVRSIPEPYLAAIFVEGVVVPSSRETYHSQGLETVKFADFGVSAVLASTSGLANTFVGTYNYMSPERIIGGNYGYKSDMWSLGLVLLECATGKFPYSAPQPGEGWVNVYELMETIVDEPPPRAPVDQFSPQFCSFIEACVQKDPKDRASANELMSHPFINMYDELAVNLSSYFTEAGSPLATL